LQKRVLIVHADYELTCLIQNWLSDLGDREGYYFRVWHETSRAAAEEKAATREKTKDKPFDLVITALEIAADESSPLAVGQQCRLGLELVRTLRSMSPELRAVIVTGRMDNELADFALQSKGTVTWAREGQEFENQLKLAVTGLLGTKKAPPQGIVSIFLSREGCWACLEEVGRGAGNPWPLEIKADNLQRLLLRSDVDVHKPNWEPLLMDVGHTLADAVLKDTDHNIEFFGALHEFIGRLGGIEHIKVRFTLDRTLHPLAVEAFKENLQHEYLMLQTVVYRELEPNIGCGTPRAGLFMDDLTKKGPLNFLIIAADLPKGAIAHVGGKDISLERLDSLEAEGADIVNQLSDLKKANELLIGEVRIVEPAKISANGSFRKLVQNTLEEKGSTWHVIHYIGHTYYDASDRVGYLFFPHPCDQQQVDQVAIEEFALWLANADTRFVYLSSCSSASHDFFYRLAEERVPAIMGFLWEVRDPSARKYAKCFYENLLKERSLEQAYLRAKQMMHASDKDDPIWASPVLVMQRGASG
jgi:CheY-like chemotaxis protein